MSRRVVGNKAILAIDAVSLAIGGYGIYTNVVETQLPEQLAKAGHWQFLTNLSLVYSLVVFGLGFGAHLVKSKSLYDLKNALHPIGLALECIVALIYWPLRLFFLDLLASDVSKFHIPWGTDLAIHLMPVVSLLIDYLVFMPKWTIRSSTALALVVFLTSGYWVLLKNLIDVESGASYPYAFMNVDTEQERLVIFSIVAVIAFSQFLFLRKFYDFIVGATEIADRKIDRSIKKNI